MGYRRLIFIPFLMILSSLAIAQQGYYVDRNGSIHIGGVNDYAIFCSTGSLRWGVTYSSSCIYIYRPSVPLAHGIYLEMAPGYNGSTYNPLYLYDGGYNSNATLLRIVTNSAKGILVQNYNAYGIVVSGASTGTTDQGYGIVVDYSGTVTYNKLPAIDVTWEGGSTWGNAVKVTQETRTSGGSCLLLNNDNAYGTGLYITTTGYGMLLNHEAGTYVTASFQDDDGSEYWKLYLRGTSNAMIEMANTRAINTLKVDSQNVIDGDGYLCGNTWVGDMSGAGYQLTISTISCLGRLDMNNQEMVNIDWANSDDGAGSGLDADLLDGQEGSYYGIRADIGTDTTTIAGNVATNTSQLTQVATDTTTIAGNVTTNTSQLTQVATDTTTIAGNVATNTSQLTQVATDTTTIQSGVDSHTGDSTIHYTTTTATSYLLSLSSATDTYLQKSSATATYLQKAGGTITGNLAIGGSLVMSNNIDLTGYSLVQCTDVELVSISAVGGVGSDIEMNDMLNLNGNSIINIGNAGTDFTSTGGLTLADDLTCEDEIRFADSDSSNYVGFKASATIAADTVWTLPAADGSADQYLKTDGGGVLSFGTPSFDTDVILCSDNEVICYNNNVVIYGGD